MIGPRRLKFLIASVRQNLDAGTGLPSAIFLNPNDDFTFACEFFVLVVGFFTVLSRGGVHHPLPLWLCLDDGKWERKSHISHCSTL